MIDGSHIAMRMPPDRGIDYYNRKDFYSIVLQAVCREDFKRFTKVYSGWPRKATVQNVPGFQMAWFVDKLEEPDAELDCNSLVIDGTLDCAQPEAEEGEIVDALTELGLRRHCQLGK